MEKLLLLELEMRLSDSGMSSAKLEVKKKINRGLIYLLVSDRYFCIFFFFFRLYIFINI